MKIPKYVDTLLKRRTRLVKQLAMVSTELDEWLDENGIQTSDDYTLTGGCMIYCEPDTAEQCVRRDILAKE